MKVLLVYPAAFRSGLGPEFPMPPLTIYYLAGLLRAEGFDVRAVDPSEYGARLSREPVVAGLIQDIDVVGISSTTAGWAEARVFAAAVKKLRPEVPIVVGGVHATSFPHHVAAHPTIDYVICGEGERSFVQLLREIEGGRQPRDIPGLGYRNGNGGVVVNPAADLLTPAELSNIPQPAYDLVPGGTYSVLPFETSRGCQFACFFCSITHKNRWRGKDPEITVEKLLDLTRNHIHKIRDNCIFFVDDCFTTTHEHVEAICSLMEKHRVRQNVVVEARAVDLVKPGMSELLQRMSIGRILIGAESGYDEGLKLIRKGRTRTRLLDECADRLARLHLINNVTYTFILGLPWEGEDEVNRTIDYAAHLVGEWGGMANFSWWIPLPSYGWSKRGDYGLPFDETLFDLLGWYKDEAVFFQTHPRFEAAAVLRIRERINRHRSTGAMLNGF